MVREGKIAVWPNLVKSFLKGNDGFMARKLTAFAFMVLIAYCTGKYVDTSNVIDAIIVFACMVLLLLAVITIEQITTIYLSYKNEKQSSIPGNRNNSTDADSAAVADNAAGKELCPACGQHLPQ